MLEPVERLIVALDVDSAQDAKSVCYKIGKGVVFYKVGLRLYLAGGRHIIDILKSEGLKVFLDLKLHDIPNQVAGACREIVGMGVDMMTIHTTGGADMMRAAAAAIKGAAEELVIKPPVLLGVTVLTSLSQVRAVEIGYNSTISEQVVRLAELAKSCGLDGVVASPHEVRAVRAAVGEDFVIVTPGIRGTEDAAQDQHRVMSAADAIEAGASYIVVGRPIIKAGNPMEAAERIVSQIVSIKNRRQ
jgi:orotidine-5'-phosphate decarboxylase